MNDAHNGNGSDIEGRGENTEAAGDGDTPAMIMAMATTVREERRRSKLGRLQC
ncbi:unnamed protein product [Linum tenue]|uniref:Uncharacterized protein n=1 Tax=Linum tenue TaxID=586396 RepID=A0AAV0Q4F6_9ROSI|nr:unnamed protein product [Linum tenue]